MSNTTMKRRIALVAVASLGFGLMSVAPANADGIADSEVVNTTAAAGVNTTLLCAAGTPTAAATPATIAVGGTYQFTLSAASGDTAYGVISGPADWTATTPAVGHSISNDGKNYTSTDADGTTAGGTPIAKITGVGAVTISWYTTTAATSLVETYYLSAVASCTAGASVARSWVQVTSSATKIDRAADWIARQSNTAVTSTAFDATTTMTTTNMDTSLDVSTNFANTEDAYIAIEANDAYGVAIGGSTNLVVISCDKSARLNSTSFSFYSASDFDGQTDTANIKVEQPVDGVAATVTCTVSVNGVLLSTKTISWAGDLATLTISASRIGEVGSASNYGRISYVAKDAAGNRLNAAIGTTDSDTGGVGVSSITLTTGSGGTMVAAVAELAAGGTYYGQSYGAGSNPYVASDGLATFQCYDYGTKDISVYAYTAAGVKITSNVAAISCEDAAIHTYTASLDKASYNQGEVATLTISGLGTGGRAVAYGTTPGSGFSVAMPGMTAVVSPTTADTETSPRTGKWVYTYTVNNGDSVSGNYNGAAKITVASTSPQYNKALAVPYTIASSGAVSNADVLKSIVALIASINKQIQALQKLILKR